MASEQSTVADIFRRAQILRRENPQMSYKELKTILAAEYKNAPFPPVYNLTIPEQDSRAPEEDWSAGLSLILRGIQQQNWNEIANGVVLSLEQTENHERERGRITHDEWHDRTVGIRDPLTKGIGKWMPPELRSLVERSKKSDK
ncbi:MAG: hypothetical protein H0T92_12925 [Pyrinomonadaceae bacterium]|nr:hypothetical protein [Pyrinomonadaceae bacterium]